MQLQEHHQRHNGQPIAPPSNHLEFTSRSGPANECLNFPFPDAHARSVTAIEHPIGTSLVQRAHEQICSAADENLSNPGLMAEHVSLQYSIPPTALANRLSPSNPSLSRNEPVADKEPAIPPLFSPSPSTALSRGAPSAQLTHEQSAANGLENISNAQLTDEQIDYVSRLARANVPATDVARLMERMRAGEARGQGSAVVNGEIRSETDQGTAPPSYDTIGEP
jgi:hypothetical protein